MHRGTLIEELLAKVALAEKAAGAARPEESTSKVDETLAPNQGNRSREKISEPEQLT